MICEKDKPESHCCKANRKSLPGKFVPTRCVASFLNQRARVVVFARRSAEGVCAIAMTTYAGEKRLAGPRRKQVIDNSAFVNAIEDNGRLPRKVPGSSQVTGATKAGTRRP